MKLNFQYPYFFKVKLILFYFTQLSKISFQYTSNIKDEILYILFDSKSSKSGLYSLPSVCLVLLSIFQVPNGPIELVATVLSCLSYLFALFSLPECFNTSSIHTFTHLTCINPWFTATRQNIQLINPPLINSKIGLLKPIFFEVHSQDCRNRRKISRPKNQTGVEAVVSELPMGGSSASEKSGFHITKVRLGR